MQLNIHPHLVIHNVSRKLLISGIIIILVWKLGETQDKNDALLKSEPSVLSDRLSINLAIIISEFSQHIKLITPVLVT